MRGLYENFNEEQKMRKVVFYGRVSTEHEAQLAALENQMQWYDEQAKYHKNWNILNKYIDEGITGTQAKKRPQFMAMIRDAKLNKFDLIVTREVCRFARNTVDTLVVTRELKNYGVEVYFVEDNIWTMDGDGELRLTIMATLAQEESRKISERVKAGQSVSRNKGVLYGNGNILGYNRDKLLGTYVINEEQAETVKMIYNMYEHGMGMGLIRDELFRKNRKDASGFVRWDTTKISRILKNATYKGYQGYFKSHRNNYLDQRVIPNSDESTYMYVKGKYEPIISEAQWDRCREIRLSRHQKHTYIDGNNTVTHCIGVRKSNDIWTKKLLCRCGHRFKRNRWRINKSGEQVFGYKCYNQRNYGGKVLLEKENMGITDGCDLREICDWKLELMAKIIFSNLLKDKDSILSCATKIYHINNKTLKESKLYLNEEIKVRLKKLQEKNQKLTDLYLENNISKEDFLSFKDKLKAEEEELVKKKSDDVTTNQEMQEDEDPVKKIKDFLLLKLDMNSHVVDRDIINKFVDTIIPMAEDQFEWYLDLDLGYKPIDEKRMLWEFKIGYVEARAYKKEANGMLRPNQWYDLNVKVYF